MTVRRVAVTVPLDVAEVARAWMLAISPEGFEEIDRGDALELAAYADPVREERIRLRFGAVEVSELPDDWRERWRAFHRPVRIGPLWIGPPWEEPTGDAVPVVIDPGRAFGTGAHATTRLCVELLLGLPPGAVLDIGSGSGVLAIAAARLGHRPVIAVDNDPAAVEATAENAAANGVDVDARLADAFVDDLPRADAVLANASFSAVPTLAARIDTLRFVTSGYFAIGQPHAPGFEHRERRERDGWAADLFERSQ
ncbi:MAG: 50S ribosomal protein L11 methyltransferase [Actinomycetota bacterium]|nr:50S ribosomal protein L11 methyltransferase [Actinomycetota bacterium]